MTQPIQADGKWDGASDVGSHLGLILFYFSSCQCITHPAEQSVLIHILWANINFNPSGESGYHLSLCAPFLLSLGALLGCLTLGCGFGRSCQGAGCAAGVWMLCGERQQGVVSEHCTPVAQGC